MKYILAIALIITLSACTSTPTGQVTKEPIKIGMIAPMTGPVAYTGDPVREGFALAHNNPNIEVIYEDGACNPQQALAAAQKLISIDQVDILVSAVCSSSTLAIAPVAERNGIPLITPIAASPHITETQVIRLSTTSEIPAQVAAEIIIEQGTKKVAIIHEENEFPQRWAEVFTEVFENKGGQVSTTESFPMSSLDMKSQLTKIKNSEHQAIVMLPISATTGKTLVKQAQEIGLDSPIIGNQVMQYRPVVESAPNGMKAIMYDYDTTDPLFQNFKNKYKQTYGHEAEIEIFGAMGYDSYNLIEHAIKQCSSIEIECMQKNLKGSFKGASGAFVIDEQGDAMRNLKFRTVHEGKLI